MQFASETNNLDLYSDCRDLCGIENGDGGATADTTTYPIKKFTRNANLALDYVESLILKADGWTKFDDTNQTGELIDISTTFLTGATKIALSLTWRKVARLRITDASGNKVTLLETPRKTLNDSQLNSTSGTPITYYRLGNYLYFDKPVSYAGTAEVEFQRGSSYFAYTDTTKAPGFDGQFHRLISYLPALDYCDFNYLEERAAKIRLRIGSPPDLMNGEPGSGMLKELVDFYAARDTDLKPNLSPTREDYGQLGMSAGGGPTSPSPKGF